MHDLERAIQVLDKENYYDNALMGWKREFHLVEAMITRDHWESGWELVDSIALPVEHEFVRGYLRAFHRWGRIRLDPAPRGKPPTWRPRYKSEDEMQDWFRKNIRTLEEGLEIIDGGKEIVLATGRRPDIVARDAKGNIVIIELKLETAGETVSGRYWRTWQSMPHKVSASGGWLWRTDSTIVLVPPPP